MRPGLARPGVSGRITISSALLCHQTAAIIWFQVIIDITFHMAVTFQNAINTLGFHGDRLCWATPDTAVWHTHTHTHTYVHTRTHTQTSTHTSTHTHLHSHTSVVIATSIHIKSWNTFKYATCLSDRFETVWVGRIHTPMFKSDDLPFDLTATSLLSALDPTSCSPLSPCDSLLC